MVDSTRDIEREVVTVSFETVFMSMIRFSFTGNKMSTSVRKIGKLKAVF